MRAAILTLFIGASFTGAAEAHHKQGHHTPPGLMKKSSEAPVGAPAQVQVPADVVFSAPDEMEYVCLVTTEVDGDPYSNVLSAEWLPRDIAMAEAESGDGFVIYHSSLNTEKGCLGW